MVEDGLARKRAHKARKRWPLVRSAADRTTRSGGRESLFRVDRARLHALARWTVSRARAVRYRAWSFGAAAGLALVLVAIALPTLASGDDPSPDAPVAPEPTLTPAQSRAAYSEQSDTEALATVRGEFEGLLDDPALKWPPSHAGEDVTGYLTEHTAVVTEPDGARGVIESTLPLRGETPHGDTAPIDLGLVDASTTSFAPKSATAAVRIPDESTGELRFPDQSFGVRLVGADPQGANVESNKAFFANVIDDGDLVLEPRAAGAEISIVLRSAAAPTSPELRFDLADGQQLRPVDATDENVPAGSVEVVEGSKRVAAVYPAVAADAAGRNVPVSYAVDGDRLALRVDTDAGTTYPVLVDPPVGVYDNNGTSAGSTNPDGFKWKNWSPQTSNDSSGNQWPWSYCNNQSAWPNRKFYFCQGSLTGTNYDGGALFIKPNNNGQQTYGGSDYGQWVHDAPDGAYIYKFDTTALSNVNPQDAQLAVGVRRADGSNWECGSVQWGDGTHLAGTATAADCPTGPAAYRTPTTTALAGATRYLFVHSQWTGDPAPSTPIGPGNRAVLRLVTSAGVPGSPLPYAQMGGAATYESEIQPPTIAPNHSSALPNPSLWVDHFSETVTPQVTDTGLGMGTATLSGSGLTTSTAHACTLNGGPGTAGATNLYDGCSLTLGLPSTTYTAPEGVDNYSITASDLVTNAAAPSSWQVKVDGGAPALTLSGTLADNAGKTLAGDTYLLHVAASDPYSGVQSTSIQIDGGTPDTVSQTCATTGCPTSQARDWTLNNAALSEGPHTITVTSKDQLGHVSAPKTITINTDRQPPSIGTLSHTGLSAWLRSGQVTTSVPATDSPSGVRKIQVTGAGAVPLVKDYGCDGVAPPCQSSQTASFTYSSDALPEGRNTLSAVASDAAGHDSAARPWEVAVDRGAPSVQPTGQLHDPPAGWLRSGSYGVHVDTTDGSATIQRSGVASIELLVDGVRQAIQTQTCAAGSCAMSRDFSVSTSSLSDGPHTVKLVTTDVAGNADTKQWTVNVDKAAPSLSVTGALKDAAGTWLNGDSYAVHADATDGVTVTSPQTQSGSTNITVAVDGATMGTTSQPCASGGCSVLNDTTVDMRNLIAGPHTVVVTATDIAGNSTQQTWTVKVDRTAPTLSVSGPLEDAEGLELVEQTYGLNAQATDNSVPQQSGVTNVVVSVGDFEATRVDVPCIAGSCSLSAAYDLIPSYFADVGLPIDVVATDAAGNKTEQSWEVNDPTPPTPLPPTCPSTPSDTAVTPTADTATPSQAISALQSAMPEVISPSDPGTADAQTLDPTLDQDTPPPPDPGDDPPPLGASEPTLAADGNVPAGVVAEKPEAGFTVGSGSEALCAKPTAMPAASTDATVVADGDAALYANTARATDTVVRPTALGTSSFDQLRTPDAPATITTNVGLQPDQHLQKLSSGAVAVVGPPLPDGEDNDGPDALGADGADTGDGSPPAPPPAADTPAGIPDVETQAADAQAQLAAARDDVTDGSVDAIIEKPWARDAAGTVVPTALTVDGSAVNLNVDKSAASDYPVIAARAFVADKCWWKSGKPYTFPYPKGRKYEHDISTIEGKSQSNLPDCRVATNRVRDDLQKLLHNNSGSGSSQWPSPGHSMKDTSTDYDSNLGFPLRDSMGSVLAWLKAEGTKEKRVWRVSQPDGTVIGRTKPGGAFFEMQGRACMKNNTLEGQYAMVVFAPGNGNYDETGEKRLKLRAFLKRDALPDGISDTAGESNDHLIDSNDITCGETQSGHTLTGGNVRPQRELSFKRLDTYIGQSSTVTREHGNLVTNPDCRRTKPTGCGKLTNYLEADDTSAITVSAASTGVAGGGVVRAVLRTADADRFRVEARLNYRDPNVPCYVPDRGWLYGKVAQWLYGYFDNGTANTIRGWILLPRPDSPGRRHHDCADAESNGVIIPESEWQR